MSQRKGAPAFGGAEALLEPGTWDRLRLTWRLFHDPRVASRVKLVVPVLAGLYLLSPVDLVPDFLLGIGQVDDLGVIGVALLVMTRLVPRLATPAVVEEHLAAMGLRRARGAGETGRDQERAAPVVDARFRVRE